MPRATVVVAGAGFGELWVARGLANRSEIFAIGDLAHLEDVEGQPLTQVARVTIQ